MGVVSGGVLVAQLMMFVGATNMAVMAEVVMVLMVVRHA